MFNSNTHHTRPNSVRSIDKLKLQGNTRKQAGGRNRHLGVRKPNVLSSISSICNPRLTPPLEFITSDRTFAKCKIEVTPRPPKFKTLKSLPSHSFHIVRGEKGNNLSSPFAKVTVKRKKASGSSSPEDSKTPLSDAYRFPSLESDIQRSLFYR